jgi:hypothetical protein
MFFLGVLCLFNHSVDRRQALLQAVLRRIQHPMLGRQSPCYGDTNVSPYIELSRMDKLISGVLGFMVRQTGRVVVWFVSLGQWRGEQLFDDEGRVHGAAGALSFVQDGRRVITDTGLLFFGITFYVVLFFFTIAYVAQA